ncbi:hypothetical protein BDC45DRAFT_535179 [Circinella umbellata]|nr:hypothetical protein BDC45DRAFT_535179 [Circinella umbellata]
MDYVIRFWSNLDKCFDNVTTIGQDRTSMATFMRVNADCEVSGIKPIDDQYHSVRPDMVVMNDSLEVVYRECGKDDYGGKSTRMRATIMDCPAGYVTRLLHMKECKIPTDPTLITTDLFDILLIMLRVKISFVKKLFMVVKSPSLTKY